MNQGEALRGFAAIAQETRLRIIRMLVTAGADGLASGSIAENLDGSPQRTSFHLRELENAGLVQSRRDGKSIIYSARFSQLSSLVAFLMHDCCQGHCKHCDEAIALLAKCEGKPTRTTH
ncbi:MULTISPECIES: ArsR/SmtB family transcription factor [Haematobacter]|uniref:ArsR family transcriptional regulator n=2 Tax=Haematobacter TaxID=366614 RepID=A0A086XU00_9RHOB|nr:MULTISPECIES: metalloregulator ArsR/SmtB family transcription factor [Haematobacter]KFI25500.1 ArsR family transcriptional regulator [Haematobacter massiliensis]OWJ69557.1 transcriptional regulator [Haematobacter massiliensis]OWJ74977.1 transcriptional regulator [Haematobacter genomosp. 1]OWJ85728.1 transcriptional regulator [Haematobacter massiliensis]